MKDIVLERYIICTEKDGVEIELINEYGFFRFEEDAKRKAFLLGDEYYHKVYYL